MISPLTKRISQDEESKLKILLNDIRTSDIAEVHSKINKYKELQRDTPLSLDHEIHRWCYCKKQNRGSIKQEENQNKETKEGTSLNPFKEIANINKRRKERSNNPKPREEINIFEELENKAPKCTITKTGRFYHKLDALEIVRPRIANRIYTPFLENAMYIDKNVKADLCNIVTVVDSPHETVPYKPLLLDEPKLIPHNKDTNYTIIEQIQADLKEFFHIDIKFVNILHKYPYSDVTYTNIFTALGIYKITNSKIIYI